MKKFFYFFIFSILFLSNVDAEERESELNKLFDQLKENDSSISHKVEMKIWRIWSTHPSKENLTNLLNKGSTLVSDKEYNQAYNVYSRVISLDPYWPEAWNKRATLLYMMGRYQESQNDIDVVLKLEKRHFGALSGQGLVQTELKNYEKAISSYKEVQKIYPSMQAPKVMIPHLKELIKNQSI